MMAAVVLALALGLFSGSVAFAATYYSTVSTMGSHGGYNFQNQAWLDNYSPGQGAAKTNVTSGTAPAGWLGVEGRVLRQSSDAICSTTGMQYSSNATSSFSRGAWRPTNSSACPSGQYYYSGGKAARWNGNGYNYQFTFRTVSVVLVN